MVTDEPKRLQVRSRDRQELRDSDYFTQLAYRGGSRFTQDSPILADVLVHYALLEDKSERLDLILTPDWEKSPREAADELRIWLGEHFRPWPEGSAGDGERELPDLEKVDETDHAIVYNQSVVAVRLRFDELLRHVLPMSSWWQDRLVAPPDRDPVSLLTDPKLRHLAHIELLEALRLEIADHDGGAGTDDYAWERRHWLIRRELAWAARLFYIVLHSNLEGRSHEPDDDPEVIAEHFLALVDHIAERQRECAQDPAEERRRSPPDRPWIYSINRNRPIERTVWDSMPITKADAACKTFGVTGSGICWAVIDTGIDARHPAFRKHNGAVIHREPFGPNGERHTRIRATYDFSDIRSKLSKAQQLALRGGRMLNWERMEKELKLRIPHTRHGYRTPVDPHGTHVAGVLAADWQPDLSEVDPLGPPVTRRTATRPIVGLCPEIELYDLRVFKQRRGDEFALMSALQFVRSLNQRHDKLEVHGVNLSLAMLHEVSNYACGRSPVCEECTRLVGTGVVVVAAAGNRGRSIYTTTQNRKEEGYRTVSIADPGNAEAVITVGSTHRREPHNYGVSYFSSRGPTGDGRSKPDLVAPGEKILSTLPRGASGQADGTSQAAPHVSGAAALLMSRHRELIGQPERIKKILMETATDLGRERHFQGAGLVDVLRAIQSV